MKKFLFTIRLTGVGDNADDAWLDAVGMTDLDSEPTPEETDYTEFEDDDDDAFDDDYDESWIL